MCNLCVLDFCCTCGHAQPMPAHAKRLAGSFWRWRRQCRCPGHSGGGAPGNGVGGEIEEDSPKNKEVLVTRTLRTEQRASLRTERSDATNGAPGLTRSDRMLLGSKDRTLLSRPNILLCSPFASCHIFLQDVRSSHYPPKKVFPHESV